MQTSARLFDDLAKVANGAASTLVGVKEELDGLIRRRLEKALTSMDLVARDEFEVVKAMAVKAREENEALKARLEAMGKAGKPKAAGKKS